MSEFVKIAFGALAAPKGGTYVVFVGADIKPSPKVTALIGAAATRLEPAAKTVRFRGKMSNFEPLPQGQMKGIRGRSRDGSVR